ncbi:MAG: hypothetical protein CL927_20750 [Deltaproteobacteria bacterium]|nr:hypothetical protein [Deltaproteobacteria bacterium]HCH63404.1 hypothetical protein [Deltaproteobacteria bacterium]
MYRSHSANPALAWTGLLAVFLAGAACVAQQDRGGQEGEEMSNGELPERGLDSGTAGSTPEPGGDTGHDDPGVDVSSVVGFEGERVHKRGPSRTAGFDCEVYWDVNAERQDDLCPHCLYAFDVAFSLREEDSQRTGYACSDAWADDAAQVGFIADYGGYGPAVVGVVPDTLETYMLAPATVTSSGLSWTYGYMHAGGSSSSGDATWYYRVDATWSE